MRRSALFGLGFSLLTIGLTLPARGQEADPVPEDAEPPVDPPRVEIIDQFGSRYLAPETVNRFFSEEAVRAYDPPTLPDGPPPHEGAMFDLPHIIGPPDLLRIEVLETLPGRPITGEVLVRPDGTIMLDMYGEIYVKGLTTQQVKIKVIEHLRRFLPDEVLGLIELQTDMPDDAEQLTLKTLFDEDELELPKTFQLPSPFDFVPPNSAPGE